MTDTVAAAFISAFIGGLASIAVALINNMFQNQREAVAGSTRSEPTPTPSSVSSQTSSAAAPPDSREPLGSTKKRRIPYAVLALVAVVVAIFSYPFFKFGSYPSPTVLGFIYLVTCGVLPLIVAGMGI